jgi:predicted transcriptional regulator
MPNVAEVNMTSKLEVDVAERTAGVTPYTAFTGWVKVMVWLVAVKVNVRLAEVADK